MHDGTVGVPKGPEIGQEAVDIGGGEEVCGGVVGFDCPVCCGKLEVVDELVGFGEVVMVVDGVRDGFVVL